MFIHLLIPFHSDDDDGNACVRVCACESGELMSIFKMIYLPTVILFIYLLMHIFNTSFIYLFIHSFIHSISDNKLLEGRNKLRQIK